MIKTPDGYVIYFPIDMQRTDVACAWHVTLNTEFGGNILAMVFRDDAISPWKLVARTRFYRDDKAHDSNDDREGYMVTSKITEDQEQVKKDLITKMDTLITFVSDKGATLDSRMENTGQTTEAFMKRWMDQHFMHSKAMSPEEAKAKYGDVYPEPTKH